LPLGVPGRIRRPVPNRGCNRLARSRCRRHWTGQWHRGYGVACKASSAEREIEKAAPRSSWQREDAGWWGTGSVLQPVL